MSAMTIVQAVNSAMRVMLARDPTVVVLGQDVGYFGGVFRCTEGLQQTFGVERVLDTPIAEGGIVAAAIGMGVNGLRPIAEIQFADYVYPAFDQMVSELARLRHRSGGEFWAPVTVRMPCGGGVRGGHRRAGAEEPFAPSPGSPARRARAHPRGRRAATGRVPGHPGALLRQVGG